MRMHEFIKPSLYAKNEKCIECGVWRQIDRGWLYRKDIGGRTIAGWILNQETQEVSEDCNIEIVKNIIDS